MCTGHLVQFLKAMAPKLEIKMEWH
jgi:hypothetical protein